jgi:hypothetical protein
MKNDKKEYQKPSVTTYGSASDVTRGGGQPGSDGQGDDSSYSPGSPAY